MPLIGNSSLSSEPTYTVPPLTTGEVSRQRKKPVQNGVARQRGAQVFGSPPHSATPAASKAATVNSCVAKWNDVAYTIPAATAGACTTAPAGPTSALQSGVQTLGAPPHPVTPLASNAYSLSEATNTIPLTATGEVKPEPMVAVHRGWQTFGTPEQFVSPVALKAASVPPAVRTNT